MLCSSFEITLLVKTLSVVHLFRIPWITHDWHVLGNQGLRNIFCGTAQSQDTKELCLFMLLSSEVPSIHLPVTNQTQTRSLQIQQIQTTYLLVVLIYWPTFFIRKLNWKWRLPSTGPWQRNRRTEIIHYQNLNLSRTKINLQWLFILPDITET